MGVEVLVNTQIEVIDRDGVLARGRRIDATNVIWCAGVEASPVARSLGAPPAQGGRVKVASDLSVPGNPEIFVIGDAAFVTTASGEPLPGLASVAKQQGQYVGELIARRVRGEPAPRPFRYRDEGRSRQSAGTLRSPISAGSNSLASRPGSCGASSTFSF
jgi:NADH dehydrogenase